MSQSSFDHYMTGVKCRGRRLITVRFRFSNLQVMSFPKCVNGSARQERPKRSKLDFTRMRCVGDAIEVKRK